MFEKTKEALEIFQEKIGCAQCKQPKNDLQFLGTSCKHAHCWDCIAEFNKKLPGKRSAVRTMCSTCAFPLDTTKIVGAHVLNTCQDTLAELKELLEQAKSAPLTQADLACTQRIFDGFQINSPENPGAKAKAVEKFLETQAHMPDEMGQEDEEEQGDMVQPRQENRQNSISPELDVFYDYKTGNTPKRSSTKRPSVSESSAESKPKRPSILKKTTKFVSEPESPTPLYDMFASQIPQRTHENDVLTPFVNRRSTAPATSGGLLNKYTDPFGSENSKKLKKEVKDEPLDENPFTKKIPLPKRQATMELQMMTAEKVAKIEEIEHSPELDAPFPTTSSAAAAAGNQNQKRRNSVKFEREAVDFPPRRSQSPMSFGEKSMMAKGEQRRSSYGTRRGEVVIVNSILNNRIPQLISAVEAGTCVNEKDKSGKTVLYVAVEQNSLEAVQILVDAGAVINASCGPTYETALHEAIRRKNLPIIEFLLSKGASLKVRNGAGKTAEELGKMDLKIRKVLEKFRNERVLQPVIPPPKSKIHFVQLIDEKMITEAEKRRLPGKINLVNADMDSPTHVVVSVNLKTKILNINKEHLADVLKAIVKSGMIVSREWLKACIIDAARVDDDHLYTVKNVQWLDGPIYKNKIDEWKRQITRMQPKLFAGCKFYFPRPKYTFLDRAALIEIVRAAGGQASAREPLVNDADPPPYHNTSLKSNFIVYGLTGIDVNEKYRNCAKYNLVCEQYIIEAILNCSIQSPPF